MSTMTLLSSPSSPFGRKVKIAARVKNVWGQIEMKPADTNAGDPALSKANPLAKIPCLILAGGTALYDSHVICEYLDTLSAAPVLFPKSGPERWRVLTQGALGDGIIEAALLMVYETRFRPEDKWVPAWIARQQAKIDASVAHLEKAPPAFHGTPDYGTLTLACALGYLDFRHAGKWRKGAPNLVKWLDAFAKAVPAYDETKPAG